MLRDVRQRQRVDLQHAEAGDHRVELHVRAHRIFVVRLCIQRLRFRRHEVFEQFHRVGLVRRVLRDRRAADVHVRAAALRVRERRPHDLDRVAPFARVAAGLRVLHVTDVVRVREADVADAAEDVARDVAVAARRLAREVRLHAAQPLLGRRFAIVRDHRRDERRVVRVLARADADLALPFRIGEILVAERIDLQVLLDVQHAVAQRQRVPVAVRAPQVRGNRVVERLRAHRLREPAVDEIEQVADVDRHQHVGRRLRAFRLHALEQAVLHEHRVDLDAALLRECVDEWLDQLRFAGGVQAHFLGRVGQRRECGGGKGEGAGKRQQAGARIRHEDSGRGRWTMGAFRGAPAARATRNITK